MGLAEHAALLWVPVAVFTRRRKGWWVAGPGVAPGHAIMPLLARLLGRSWTSLFQQRRPEVSQYLVAYQGDWAGMYRDERWGYLAGEGEAVEAGDQNGRRFLLTSEFSGYIFVLRYKTVGGG